MDINTTLESEHKQRSEMTDRELLDDIEREMRDAFEHDLAFQVARRDEFEEGLQEDIDAEMECV